MSKNDTDEDHDYDPPETQSLIDKSTINLEEQKPKRNKIDLIIVFTVLFLSEAARGIVVPTIAEYVTSNGGTATFLGIVIASFSTGRLLSTILLGYVSTKVSYRLVFVVSVIICIIGSFFYSFAYYRPVSMPFIIVARSLLGFGAGTLSVVRAYVAQVTTSKERTSFVAISGAVQFLGFAVTPSFGSLLALVPTFYIGSIMFNAYTLPSWLLIIANVGLILLLCLVFKDPEPVTPLPKRKSAINESEEAPLAINSFDGRTEGGLTGVEEEMPQVKTVAPSIWRTIWEDKSLLLQLVVFVTINFFIRSALGIFETLGAPIYNKLTNSESTSGFYFGGLGLLGVGVLLGINLMSKRGVRDFYILIVGNIVMVAGCTVMITAHEDLYHFVIGTFLIWVIGFPLAQTVVVSMFSKRISATLGKASQGTLMGIIGAAGSGGRIVGPLISGWLYTNYSTAAVFSYATGLTVVALLVCLLVVPEDIKDSIFRSNNNQVPLISPVSKSSSPRL
ncbi:hypothetical protein SAMD00019534_002030 [Acytostelium subglobosum LB1]|uniref:hypothetical protein n=1 Tax=Acytostelium subglobosum LB1 TaxID=1410327 RepID=UPI0006451744|nr:hypothetical protein SAMD00019534_002030 [Acytostelium subglobosum LB1]GAM17028.1 hypothetical protein SAMD00019534_002030 [Acytostelium subglobosum LB1]|eukprot:XP_012759090.1 hypothetical protein SAMD00019534_002030 [Acytostelium subglobosum LB1]